MVPEKLTHIFKTLRFPSWLITLAAASFFAVTAVVIYSNVLNGPFILDDFSNIVNNSNMQLSRITLENARKAAFEAACPNRPVANLSLALNYYFHQYRTFGYHAGNVAVHILTGIFLFLLLRVTLVMAREKYASPLASSMKDPTAIAFMAVLLWLVHPLNTQAVSYVVQRMTSMAGMFYVLSMLCYVMCRKARRLAGKAAFGAGSLLAGALALGTKEITVTLPVFMMLYEWFFFQDMDRKWVRKMLILTLGAGAAAACLAFVYMGVNPVRTLLDIYGFREFTLSQRVLTELRVVVLYMSLILFPYYGRLNLDYDFPLSYSLLSPVTTLLSLVVIVGAVCLAVYLAKKDRIVTFAILWFFGNLLLESSIVPLELVYEHRVYLPSMFIVPVIAMAALYFARPRWAGIALVFAIAAVFSFWTYERNAYWADAELFWKDCVAKSPHKARPHNNYGFVLMNKGKYREAISEYNRALGIPVNPYISEIYGNLGIASMGLGKPDDARKYFSLSIEHKSQNKALLGEWYATIGGTCAKHGLYAEAEEYLLKALQINPGSVKARLFLGMAFESQGKNDQAIEQLEIVLKQDPGSAKAHAHMGTAVYHAGNVRRAAELLREAVRLDPSGADARAKLGIVLMAQGRLVEAIGQLETALKLDPGNTEALQAVKPARERRGIIEKELAASRKIFSVKPDDAALLKKMGGLYKMLGDFAGALDLYKQALAREPQNKTLLLDMAVASAELGDYVTALGALEKIKAAEPENPEAYYNIACIYARQGRVQEAVEWLEGAVERGFSNWELAKSDSDLDSIRKSEYYQKLMAKK